MRCFREGQQVYRGRHVRWLGRAHGPRHRSLPHRSRRHRDDAARPGAIHQEAGEGAGQGVRPQDRGDPHHENKRVDGLVSS